MAERLQDWGRQVGDRNPYANAALLKSLPQKIANNSNAGQRLDLEYQLAEEFLNAGQPEDCLTVVSNMIHSPWRGRVSIAPSSRRQIRLPAERC